MTTQQIARHARSYAALAAVVISILPASALAGPRTRPADGRTIVVTGTVDARNAADAVMTLGEAIELANTTPERDRIIFALPDPSARTLVLTEPLPEIVAPIVIDGYDESGLAQSPKITLDGSLLAARSHGSKFGDVGLAITAGRSIVRGIVVESFSGHGISLTGRGGNVVEGCFVGVDPNDPAAGGGNGGDGIFISSPNNVIGGVGDVTPLPYNVISGNGSHGVEIMGGNNNLVVANVIGGGLDTPGNDGCGVVIAQGTGNTIGGTHKGEGNMIVANADAGVRIVSGTANRIASNIVTGNHGLAIDLGPDGETPNDDGDLDRGANGLQNTPVLRAVASDPYATAIDGVLESAPNTAYRIELFAGSGLGDANEFLKSVDVVTSASGIATFSVSIPLGPTNGTITATATDPNGNTSELSAGTDVGGKL